MMFLQYFVWGAWFVTLGTYIGANTGDSGRRIFDDGFIGAAYGTAAIAAMIAPFFVGMVADRFFATQRMLAVLHLAGAGVLYYLSTVGSQALFYAVLIGYFLCYMPTLALTNSLSFHHLQNPEKQFPAIRVLGTIGWIVAGMLVGFLRRMDDGTYVLVLNEPYGLPISYNANLAAQSASIEPTATPMLIAVAMQVVLAIYCLVLPHTPPSGRTDKITASEVLGLDALRLMKSWSFAVFVIGSFLIAIPLQWYYNYTNFYLNDIGVENAAAKMILGQVSEIFFMLLMPFFFMRLGVKYMLLVGMLCWSVRYALFAAGDAGSGMWMLYIGILLHGICYDFFFVTGQIYVDSKADKSIRGAAQGFITFVTLGVGSFIGANLSGFIDRLVRTQMEMGWFTFWILPSIGAAVVMVLFALAFYDGAKPVKEKTPEHPLAPEVGVPKTT
jgi:nucleoside transporter